MPLYNPVFPAKDNIFAVVDDVNTTKKVVLQLSGITGSTTRTYIAPNASGTLVLDTFAQTLTNKIMAINDGDLTILNSVDPTKSFQFDVSAIDPSTGVYLFVPQFGGYLVTTFDAASAQIQTILTATATLDFPNTLAASSSDLTMTLTGAVDGDSIMLGVPNGSVNANTAYFAWVSAANTVTVRFINFDIALSSNPASGTFRATIIRF